MGSGATWSSLFVFEMRLILSGCRHLWQLLSNQIIYSLSTRISFFFRLVLLNKSLFFINSWSRRIFSSQKIILAEFRTNFASWIGNRCKISCWRWHIMIWSWSLLSFSQILSLRRPYKCTMFSHKLGFTLILSWSGFKGIMVENYLIWRFAFIAKCLNWWSIENLICLDFVVLRSRAMLSVVDKFRTHWFFYSLLNFSMYTVI